MYTCISSNYTTTIYPSPQVGATLHLSGSNSTFSLKNTEVNISKGVALQSQHVLILDLCGKPNAHPTKMWRCLPSGKLT